MSLFPKEIWLLIFKHAFIAESLLFEGFSVCLWWQPLIIEVLESYEINHQSRVITDPVLNRLTNLKRLETINNLYITAEGLETFTKLSSLTLDLTYRNNLMPTCLLNITTLTELNITGSIYLPIPKAPLKS